MYSLVAILCVCVPAFAGFSKEYCLYEERLLDCGVVLLIDSFWKARGIIEEKSSCGDTG